VSRSAPVPGGEEVLCRKLALAMLRDEAVKRVQRGRTANRDELWGDVLSGRSQLVDSFKRGGYRYFVVLPQADATDTITALDRRSEEVLGVLAPTLGRPKATSRRS
jgi:hypothetical protein